MQKEFKPANQILGEAYLKAQESLEQKPAETVQSSPEPEKKVEQPETTSKAEVKPETTEPAKQDTESGEFNFDLEDEPVAPKAEEPKSFDFKSYVKDLGFEDVKDEEEFKTRVKELKSKPSELEGIPDNLKKAIELSKKGGDFLSYLKISQVDYSSIAPEAIYEHYVKSKLSPEDAADKLANISVVDKKLEGLKLREQYIAHQKAQEAELERAAMTAQREIAERKAKADQKLKQVLDNVNEIAGLKLKPGQKQDIFEAITTGRMQKELFYDQKTGEYDFNSMIETYFVKKNLPKIISKIEQVTKSKTTKSIIKDIQNVQIDKPTEKPAVEQDKRPALHQYIDELNDRWRKPKK